MTQNDVKLKLLIDMKGKRVVFAEADKKVVDFLFHLLSLPLGTVCRQLQKKSMVGCLGNLYTSVETLNRTYLQPNHNRETLLKPKVISFCSSAMLLPYTHPPPLQKYYMCEKNSSYADCLYYISYEPKAVCPKCNGHMSREVTYVKPPSGSTKPISTTSEEDQEDEGGYVKGEVTYLVMDDLTVYPMNPMYTISSMTDLMNQFNIMEVNSLEERIIILDVNKGVELLKASLQSNTVLTDVFLSEH